MDLGRWTVLPSLRPRVASREFFAVFGAEAVRGDAAAAGEPAEAGSPAQFVYQHAFTLAGGSGGAACC